MTSHNSISFKSRSRFIRGTSTKNGTDAHFCARPLVPENQDWPGITISTDTAHLSTKNELHRYSKKSWLPCLHISSWPESTTQWLKKRR